jgi:hypothetical protein
MSKNKSELLVKHIGILPASDMTEGQRQCIFDCMDEYAKEVAIQFLKDCISEAAFVKPNIRGGWYHGDEEDGHGRDTARDVWNQIQKYKSNQP